MAGTDAVTFNRRESELIPAQAFTEETHIDLQGYACSACFKATHILEDLSLYAAWAWNGSKSHTKSPPLTKHEHKVEMFR